MEITLNFNNIKNIIKLAQNIIKPPFFKSQNTHEALCGPINTIRAHKVILGPSISWKLPFSSINETYQGNSLKNNGLARLLRDTAHSS